MKATWHVIVLLCLVVGLLLTGCVPKTVPGNRNSVSLNNDSPPKGHASGQPGSGLQQKPSASSGSQEIKPHPILGVSQYLSQQGWHNMQRWRQEILQTALQNPNEVFLNGEPSVPTVCLTFDDGPDPVFTPQVLEILERYGVPGNFFFIGQQVKAYPNIALRAYRDGNLVLNHTWSHADLTSCEDQAVERQVEQAEEEIDQVIGKRPAILRPPYGSVNERVIRDLSSNYKLVIWSIDTLDWSQKEKLNIVKNVMDNVRPGDIILMHSCAGRQATVDALPQVISGLRSKGFGFTTLDRMLKIPAYQ